MEKHWLVISKVSKWLDANEYEGQISGTINGFQISCHLLDMSGKSWEYLTPGSEIDVNMWIACVGDNPSKIDSEIYKFELYPKDRYELLYIVCGKVIGINGNEQLTLSTNFPTPINVEMEINPREYEQYKFSLGNFIKFIGLLEIRIIE